MSGERETELRRLTEILHLMAVGTKDPQQIEALRKGAAALGLVFTNGLWQELAELEGPLTEEMREHLGRLGLDPGGRRQ